VIIEHRAQGLKYGNPESKTNNNRILNPQKTGPNAIQRLKMIEWSENIRQTKTVIYFIPR